MKFTMIRSKTNISKSFTLNKNELVKKDGGNLHKGSFKTVDMGLKGLENFIQNCSSKEILIQGLTDFDDGMITTKKDISNYEHAEHATVSRSKDFFTYKENVEGFLLLDYDPNENYKNGTVLSKEEFLEKIYSVVPEIEDVPHLWKTSSGSNIVQLKDENGKTVYKELTGVKGQHLFIAVSDVSLIPDFFDFLYKKLWNIGEGYIFIDKVGRLHDRTIVDKVVNSPEREIFLRACLTEELGQDLMLEGFNYDAKALDLALLLSINEEEIIDVDEKYDVLHKNELSKLKSKSKKVLDSYIKKNAKRHKVTEDSLRLSVIERKLFSDFEIKLSDNSYVTVLEILENPEKYDGKYCYEPFEPEYGGYCNTKAWIDPYNERIFSHAHGGIEYAMVDSKKKSPDQLAHHLLGIPKEKDRYVEAGKLTLKYKYEATEVDSLLKKISNSTGQNHKSVRQTFDKYSKVNVGKIGDRSVRLDSDLKKSVYEEPLGILFPHTDNKGNNSSTMANLRFMLDNYHISLRYNAITKISSVHIPREKKDEVTNLTNEADFLNIQSMCVVNGMSKDTVSYLEGLMNENVVSPVYDYINGVEWDGVDRLGEFIDRINCNFRLFEDEKRNVSFGKRYMKKVVRMWLIQCIAALDGAKNSPIKNCIPSFEYVLVFVGGQGISKTKFISSLLPFEFRDHIVTGHELDTKNKDSVKKAISSWICELGELDSTFKKSEISSLKAFLSDEFDILRLPYGKAELRMKRNTVFCASVNGKDFLRDKTGNRRYLPVSVNQLRPLYEEYEGSVKDIIEGVSEDKNGELSLNGKKKVVDRSVKYGAMNIQQLWSQILVMYLDGEQWWPDSDLEDMLIKATEGHSDTSLVNESIIEYIDVEKNDDWREKLHVKGDNSRWVKKCSEAVSENMRNNLKENIINKYGYLGKGSIDEFGKSITVFEGVNVKEVFSYIGLEYNRLNMREFNEYMDKYGFTYGKKRVEGVLKRCFWFSFKKKLSFPKNVVKM